MLDGRRFEEHELKLSVGQDVVRKLRLLWLPPLKSGSPVLLALNKCGNHTLLPDAQITAYPESEPAADPCPDRAGDRGGQAEDWRVRELLDSGLGLMTLHASDIAPDQPQAFQRLLTQLEPHQLVDNSSPPGLLALWAWGLSAVLDYSPRLTSGPVGLFGHSRRGKAALLCAALDQRPHFVIAHQSGTLGMVSVQDWPSEPLESILTFFPHWFTPGLQQWRGRANELPLRQSELLSQIAPRPVIASEGLLDFWASPWLSERTLSEIQSQNPEMPVRFNHALAGHGPAPQDWQDVAIFLKQAHQDSNLD